VQLLGQAERVVAGPRRIEAVRRQPEVDQRPRDADAAPLTN
jgi:hypothetical protein